jgi:hypothetical protein
MKKLPYYLLFTGVLLFTACSGDAIKSDAESNASEEATANDSSTTNPMNSEYGTPNASENPVDSAQSANQK